MKLAIETIDVSIQELEVLVDRTRQELLDEEGYRKLKGAIETLGQMARMLADQKTTLRQLRDLLLKPPATEKTRAVLERAGIATRQNQPNGGDQKPDATGPAQADQKKKGHGTCVPHAERTQAWAQPGAGFSGSAEGARPASHPEAGRPLSGMPERESVPAARAGLPRADRGSSARAGNRLRSGEDALQLVPGGIHGAGAGRGGGEKVR